MPRLPGSRIPGRHGPNIAIKYIAAYAFRTREKATFDEQALKARTTIGKSRRSPAATAPHGVGTGFRAC